MAQVSMHGHDVSYDETASVGAQYLINRSDEEVRPFFDEAYSHGYAIFEDHNGTKFKLTHENGAYQLVHM